MYRPSFWFKNKHIATVYPSLYRKIDGVNYQRERIPTRDDDFLDLDWLTNNHHRLLVISHGLEGSSQRHYVTGTAKLLHQNGWDVLAWNCRSCSGEMNNTLKLYHHGASEDVHDVINHVIRHKNYQQLFLVGYSLGGSLTTKFLSELNDQQEKVIIGGMAVSTPFDVKGSAQVLNQKGRGFYRKRFLNKLFKKIRIKAEQFPGQLDVDGLEQIKTFRELDMRYSAPLNGFDDVDDFYRYISAGNYIEHTKKPLFALSSLDDPILSDSCFPKPKANTNYQVEYTRYGGHVGFFMKNDEFTYAEYRCLEVANKASKLQ